MVTAISTGLIVFIAGLVLFFVGRWILRLAIKAAFVLALVFVLLAAGTIGWWRGWFSSLSSSEPRPATQTNQPRNANRRPPSR